MWGVSVDWLRLYGPARTRSGRRYHEDHLRAWLKSRAVREPEGLPLLDLLYGPADCARIFDGSGSAKVWRVRMQGWPTADGPDQCLDLTRVYRFGPRLRVALGAAARFLAA